MILIGMRISFVLFHSNSLKDKRSVVKSITHKLHNKFNVSVAEIDALDILNQGVIAVGVVGNDRKLCNQILDKAVKEIESNYEIEIHDIQYIEA